MNHAGAMPCYWRIDGSLSLTPHAMEKVLHIMIVNIMKQGRNIRSVGDDILRKVFLFQFVLISILFTLLLSYKCTIGPMALLRVMF